MEGGRAKGRFVPIARREPTALLVQHNVVGVAVVVWSVVGEVGGENSGIEDRSDDGADAKIHAEGKLDLQRGLVEQRVRRRQQKEVDVELEKPSDITRAVDAGTNAAD